MFDLLDGLFGGGSEGAAGGSTGPITNTATAQNFNTITQNVGLAESAPISTNTMIVIAAAAVLIIVLLRK